jgi:hypothetical protein
MHQLDRANRYLNRLRQIYAGVPAKWEDRLAHEDDAYTFFVHCYHVRDWIIELNRAGATASVIDEYINSHTCLRICADLCNASKHCRLTRNTRTGSQPHIIYTEHEHGVIDQVQVLKSSFTIYAQGETFDALDLAESCMQAWSDLIQEFRKTIADRSADTGA